MDDSKPIWIFTPSRSNPEDLEAILVQRHALLQDAVERVKESALTGHKHHLLFVGPRGSGKSHLSTLIVHRLAQDAELNEKLLIAWLNEDETCTSVLELLLRIHAALEKRYPAEFQKEAIGQVYEMESTDAQAYLQKYLVKALHGRTLLVLAENLDAIFEGLGDKGQKALRAFIQENPYLTFVATAQRLVEDLSKRTNPFFGFFQTEHMKPLNVSEATELLQNIARLRGNQEVVDFLATSQGRSRVRALHHLSGGNHRIYIVLSQFITRDSIDALVGPFMKMVDELTPYYQERIRWLPVQQRKIVEYLCACETTVPVKDIAKRLFSTPQTVSSQLQNLREKGYVEASQRGRESLYEITEPLMRICVEVKENQTHEPLRLLVNFLRVWYDDLEMNQKLGALEKGCIASRYLESAIHRNTLEGSLRKKIFIEELEGSLPGNLTEEIKRYIIGVCNNLPEEFTLGYKSMSEGKKEEAREYFDHIIYTHPHPYAKIIATTLRADCWEMVNFEKAISDYTEVINFKEAPQALVIQCLMARGNLYAENDPSLAEKDFTKVIKHNEVPKDVLIQSLIKRGLNYFKLMDYKKAIADYSDVIDTVDDNNKNARRSAYFIRGLAYQASGNPHKSIEDLSNYLESANITDVSIADALFFRSQAYIAIESNNARDDLERLLRLDDLPSDLITEVLLSLAFLYIKNGSWEESISLIDRALEIKDDWENTNALIILSQLIQACFTANISPDDKTLKLTELTYVYSKHGILEILGYIIINHVSSLYKRGNPFPANDTLDSWHQCWERVTEGTEELALPLRLMRTCIDFIKQGGIDESTMLTLTTSERDILKQALGLSEPEE
jgi:tetratricopeptide (TPR) repeat protein